MLEKIETQSSIGNSKVEFNTIIKPNKRLKSEDIINRALYTVIVLLVLGVLSSFFVQELPGFVLDLRNIAIDALWVMACCFCIGELFKRVFINKARSTEEYGKIKEEAENALNTLSSNELDCRAEYCKAYEDEEYNRQLKRCLANIGISEEEYKEKYFSLSRKELKKIYGESLSKTQLNDLAQINKLKRVNYNPDFFTVSLETKEDCSPSQMFNANKENKRNSFSSAFTSIASGFFCVTFAGGFAFSFSMSALFGAIIKIITIIISASSKATFGWNLVMVTEVNRYKLQISEVKKLKNFCANKGE